MRALLKDAAIRLAAAGVDTPEHDAKLLLAEAAGCSLRDLDLTLLMGRNPSSTPLEEIRPRFEAMISRRAAREPLQHIVGHAPFRWLDLKVGPGVFIPRPETELVVQFGLDWLAAHGNDAPRVADLCAGSGAIGLSVATELPHSEVWAVELSAQALQWTRLNASQVMPQSSLEASWPLPQRRLSVQPTGDGATAEANPRYHLIQSDATAPATLADLDGTFDAVLTNPPYVPQAAIPDQPEVRDHDPELALYGGSPDGLDIPRRIIDRAVNLLKPQGLLVMEHDITQGPALVAHALAAGFATARTEQDFTGRDRYLVACRDS